MTNDDQIAINKDGEKVEIKDNETGAEYIIDMGGEDTKNEEPETMEESKIFEIALGFKIDGIMAQIIKVIRIIIAINT